MKIIKRMIPEVLKEKIRNQIQLLNMPADSKQVVKRNKKGLFIQDPGIDICVEKALGWILNAQENSKTFDGGVARYFSLISGWDASYPETTGYIIPTMINCGKYYQRDDLIESARKMLDWCEKIQLECGAFQGGTIIHEPVVPVTFNTGQILIGLSTGFKYFKSYEKSMHKAAAWLVDTLDDDGCWRKYPTPFAKYGEKAYETHVSWGLFEASKVSGKETYALAGLRNVDWALTKQHDNGWFSDCCLDMPDMPLTHTLGYVLRGILEAYKYSDKAIYLEKAMLTADALLDCINSNGYLPGRFNPDWSTTVNWSCLTGTVQIALCWMIIYQEIGEQKYLNAAKLANRYVRKTMVTNGAVGIEGGIQGSFPVYGGYGEHRYLNWAAKFFIDSNLMEQSLIDSSL